MADDLIIGEELNFIRTCGDGEVITTLHDNLPYFVNVSKKLYEFGNNNKVVSSWTKPRIRAKVVEDWLRDNDGTEGIDETEGIKTFGLWKVIQRHKLDPDKIFPLLALYVVQCEINGCE